MPTIKPSIGFFGPSRTFASGRYRNIMPYNWLLDNGWKEGSDVLVSMKHMWPYDPTKDYGKYIFDICDDHFNNKKIADHYYHHCELADLVTCNSEVMSDIILEKTGRVPFIIPDPVEFERQAPHYCKTFLCFGHEWNVSLLNSIPNLGHALKGKPLEIVSEPFEPFVTPYSRENIIEAFSRAGAVLIPVGKKKAKSANRLIESINAGCFVICNDMPAYEEFREFAWVGDIVEGIEWYINNKEEALKKIKEGQEYISKKYTIDQIGPMWGDAIGAC